MVVVAALHLSRSLVSSSAKNVMKMDNDTKIIETNEMPEKKKRSKLTKFLWALVALLALALAGSWVWIHHISNNKDAATMGLKNANGQVAELQSKITDLNIQLDTTSIALKKERTAREALMKESDSLRNLFPIYIKKLEVANADGNGRPISTYGNDIVAANSMYLLPRITYYGFRPGEKLELQVKLYGPDGKVITGNESPKDNAYSYTYTINSVYPTDNVVSLKGWGGSDRGHFLPGTYRYEVWYNDMCFKAVTFKLK